MRSSDRNYRRARAPLTRLDLRRWIVPPPVPLTPILGREPDMAAARDQLDRPECRLLTLTGPGGIGKTRLALALVDEVATRFDGVAWAPLDAVRDPAAVLPAVARALGGGVTLPPIDAARAALGDARILLVVDNLEQVLAAAPDLAALLSACPALTMLATSRAVLRIRGEQVFTLAPLDVPEPDAADDALATCAAIRLFVQRATAVAPAFAVTAETLPVVGDICRRLDGMPLAIELMAACINVLPVSQLRDRLEAGQRLPLLGGPDLPARQRTMHDSIAWSYDLLHPRVQAIFRHLAVFSDGFTLDAVESVVSQATIDDIASLVDAHLIYLDPASRDVCRYKMLVPIQEFAASRLDASGDNLAARRAHADFFVAFAERHELADLSADGQRAVESLESDHANLRTALAWFDTTGDQGGVGRLAAALCRFWTVRGHYAEGRRWMDRILVGNGSVSVPLHLKILNGLGYIALLQGDSPGAQASFALCVANRDDDVGALSVAQALVSLGGIATQQGAYELAISYLVDASEVAARIPDARLSAIVVGRAIANLGNIAWEQGDLALAMERGQESKRLFRDAGYALGMPLIVRNLAMFALAQGDMADANGHVRELLTGNKELGNPRFPIEAIEIAALIAVEQHRPQQAARWFGAAAALRERIGLWLSLPPSERAMRERAHASLRSGMGTAVFTAAWNTGGAASFDHIVEEVLGVPEPSSASVRQVQLTRRERDVLHLLVGGLSDRAIGEALFIGERTVQSHLATLYAKLGVHSRTAAIVAAIAAGLVHPPAADR